MADEQPQLKRDGTMQVTVKEGIEFLKSQGKDHLEANSNGDKPQVPRDGTMDATLKEGKEFLENAGGELADGVRTRGDQEKGDDDDDTPKIVRDNTMVETAKEGKEFLGDDVPLGETRNQSKVIAEAQEEEKKDEEEDDDDESKEEEEEEDEDEEEDETAALKRTHTMAETLEEGEAFLKKQKAANGDSVEADVKEDS